MNRRTLGVVGLLALIALAGCSALFGPPGADEAALAENASYEWDTQTNATLTLETSSYTAIYRVENRSEFALYSRDALGQEQSVGISALRFRYPNGTEISTADTGLSVDRSGGRTTFTLPGNVSGQIAFEAPRHGKAFGVPTHVDGSYAVTLPRGARVGVPILADVSPGDFGTDLQDDRLTVTWADVETNQVRVRWYLQRDLLIFSLLVGVLAVVGSGGVVFFYRQIRRLRARREEVGLDVDHEDDDPRDRGPPPGMR